jgi:hypothetical protein
MPTRQEIEQREGELAEIQRIEAQKHDRREQSAAQSLPELIELGRKRGYKNPAYWARMVLSGRKERRATV